MLKGLFKSDKAPFILSLTLSILGWLVTTTIGNLSDVIILGINTSRNLDRAIFTVTNHSVKKPLVDGVMNFTCIKDNCLTPNANGGYAIMRQIVPYSIQGNTVCSPSARNFFAVLSLPPKAQIQFETTLKGDEIPRFQFNGTLMDDTRGCPSSSSKLKVDNIWVIEGWSLTLLLVDYYYHFLFGSILVTLAFLIVVLLRSSPTPTRKRRGA